MKKLLASSALALATGAALLSACGPGAAQESEPTALPPVQTTERIIAEARVVPARSADLSFPVSGVVAEVLAQEGDQVPAGAPIVRLNSAREAAALAQAEAELEHQRANYAQLLDGATPEEIAAAESQLERARSELRRIQGSVTDQDIQAAEAQVAEARARLERLQAGPKAADIRAAEARLEQAQAQLASERDRLSAAKTDAQLAMDRAVAELTKTQSEYVIAKKNWEHVDQTGKDPMTSFGLNDAQQREYFNAFVQAEEAMHIAEAAVEQARIAYDGARQAEVNGVRAAEQQVAEAEAELERVLQGAETDEIAAARAALAQSQAELNRLLGEERAGALAAAQASVAEAEAQLAQLRASATDSELAVALAQIQRAEASVLSAQAALADLELKAPFDGVIVAMGLEPSEFVAAGTPVVHLADLAAWEVETTDLTELDVVRINPGMPATITIDALPDVELPGTVERVTAYGENRQGDIVYKVIVVPNQHDERLRWNMTASVSIEPAE